MIIEFEGREWAFDTEDLDVKQATVLWKTYQMTIFEWTEGFDKGDQRSYHFAYWLMREQNGERKPIEGCNPKIIDFMSAVTDARVAEAAKQKAEADAAEAAAVPEPVPFPPAAQPSAAPSYPLATALPPPVVPTVS